MAEKTIQRAIHEKSYTVISNSALQDKRLSWKARGLLCYLLSLPDDWRIYISELTNRAPDGETATRSAMKELIDADYVTRVFERDDKKRITAVRYFVFETTRTEPEAEPEPQDLDGENLDLENLNLGNQALQSTHDTKTPTAGRPGVPATLDDWLALIEDSTNKVAVLRWMFITLYPKKPEPDFVWVGTVKNKVDGPERLAQLLWISCAYRVTGDPLKYCLGLAKGKEPEDESDIIEVSVI